ncbi:MAG: CHAT domain-containing protein [Richelia sp. SL_2_1]|nr:CHAT domain-containing protein [Richelia sp. SL_2_1]
MKTKQWIVQLTNQLTELASILQIDQIVSLVPSHCKKVILVPHLDLHLLPLHVLPLSSGKYLIDKFSDGVSYAPSCQLLQYAQQKLQKPRQSRHLFAIQNPIEDLPFTDIEVETIAANFKSHYIIKQNAATKFSLSQQPNANHLNDAYLLHFSCHGYFNRESSLKSALILANARISPIPADADSSRFLKVSDNVAIDLEKCLTLEDIFQLNLGNCRLVVLSACETGLTNLGNTDEYIGLPSGFIRAGSPSVVSSLWNVSDISTALLMIKFYENLQNLDVPLALKEAQTWLRNATKQELEEWASNKFHNPEHIVQLQSSLFRKPPNSKPFESPYYWAAFCAIGK